MGQKALKSGGKPMPTTLAVVGVLATVYNVKKYLDWKDWRHFDEDKCMCNKISVGL